MMWGTPEVKQLNLETIRKEIQNSGECTKAEIARKTSLSIVTCNTLLNELLEEQEILAADHQGIKTGRPGRPASQYIYNVDYIHVLGIYVDTHSTGFKIEYVVADAFGQQRQQEEIYAEQMDYNYIEEKIAQILEKDPLIKGISFGIPGVLDSGVVERCDVESFVGVDIKGGLEKRFGIDVEVRNDMDFISYGVYNGASLTTGNLATMFFPTTNNSYVGAGFIIDGKVLNGSSHFSGELSYVAEGFGFTREQQRKMLNDRDEFCELVSRMLLIVIGTIDPKKIVVMGNGINAEELMKIWKICNKVVPENHLPELSADNNIERNYLNGLIQVELNKLQFPLSMPL